jgi:sugar/nucleoside kinase (ribokinase family)
MTNKKYAVTGIGNAIVDIILMTSDDFLEKNALYKGSMTLISEGEATKLSALKYEKIISGGSVANSVACLASLDVKTAFIGKVGDGKFGEIFSAELRKLNIDFFCQKKGPHNSTAKSFIMVSPDGQRTMATYLGAASDINDEIDENVIKDSEILYLEGYLWDKAATITALKSAIQIAKANQTLVAFTLSDAFCVIRHKEEFLELAKDLDILFTNEAEVKALFDMNKIDVKTIAKFAADNKLILSTTVGEKGAIIFDGKNAGKIEEVSTEKVEPLDSTGAGDCFAAGFLYGLTKKYPLKQCATIGNIFAGKIITKIGARYEENEIKELQSRI